MKDKMSSQNNIEEKKKKLHKKTKGRALGMVVKTPVRTPVSHIGVPGFKS